MLFSASKDFTMKQAARVIHYPASRKDRQAYAPLILSFPILSSAYDISDVAVFQHGQLSVLDKQSEDKLIQPESKHYIYRVLVALTV